ncbi:hypothetical protein AB0I81_56555 [Nonomuraea sp. NPDC050404]|uniref:hypothetical protein n=1 Tax=Nonomuraea sp. NPDC050404 TaxID=3155783 RepID=UPI0033CB6646
MRKLRPASLISAFLLAGIVSTAGATASEATTAQAPLCPYNYLCITTTAPGANPDQLIPAGQSKTFPGGIRAYEFVNNTSMLYCVGGSPSFALPPRDSRSFNPAIRVVSVSTRGTPTGFCVAT